MMYETPRNILKWLPLKLTEHSPEPEPEPEHKPGSEE